MFLGDVCVCINAVVKNVETRERRRRDRREGFEREVNGRL
jgi:hypothetical protein